MKGVNNSLKAVIVGATGLVGRELVRVLLSAKKYEKITVIARRRLSIVHPRLEQQLIEFEHIQDCQPHWFENADVFCTLGTTIKKAGSREQFEKVDYHYVLEFAKLGKKYGARKYVVVSAMFANANSRIFYSRVKGKVEQALQELHLPQLIIVRPSLIVGDRTEFRLGEWSMTKLFDWMPLLFKGKMKKHKPNQAKDIAIAMYKLAAACQEAVKLVLAHEIDQWAKMKLSK